MFVYGDLPPNGVKIWTQVSPLATDIHCIEAPNAHAAAFFLLALAFLPSERGRGVTTNLLMFDFVLVL